jgi:drug/metabolite transporter (DMT)-like permease
MASDPFSVQISWNTAMVLTAACLWGYVVILMRQVSRRESSLLQMLFQNLCFLGVTSVLTAGTFVMPDRFQLTLLIAIGVLGGGGQYLMIEGCRLAPATRRSLLCTRARGLVRLPDTRSSGYPRRG